MEKIIKNFELLELARSNNNLSHTVLEFSSRSSAVQLQQISTKPPYTLLMEVRVRPLANELSYIATLIGKKQTIALALKKRVDKQDKY